VITSRPLVLDESEYITCAALGLCIDNRLHEL